MSEHKVGRKNNPIMFWAPVGTYCLNNDNFIKKFDQNLATLDDH